MIHISARALEPPEWEHVTATTEGSTVITFGDCNDDGHTPVWKPYPRGAQGEFVDGKPRGTISCVSCGLPMDFGVLEPARRRG